MYALQYGLVWLTMNLCTHTRVVLRGPERRGKVLGSGNAKYVYSYVVCLHFCQDASITQAEAALSAFSTSAE